MPESVTYDDAQRPRVLICRVDPAIVDGLIPTVQELTANRTLAAVRNGSWDAIITKGSPHGGWGSNHRILQFGANPISAPREGGQRNLSLTRSLGSEVILTAEAPEEWREELKNSVVAHVRSLRPPRSVISRPDDRAITNFIPLVVDADGRAFAAIYTPNNSATEVIYLPDGVEPSRAWVILALERWSATEPDTFPPGPEWRHRRQWMTAEEISALDVVEAAQSELEATTAELERRLVTAREGLNELRVLGDSGERRLLTASGDDLVDAVVKALRGLGFDVESRDETRAGQKMEDLRIRDGDEWIAIAEVKGYAGGGKTPDLLSLGRFSKAFRREMASFPDAHWYIVNQFRTRDPDSRKPLLRGQDEDVDAFAADDGAVIDTRDLFRVQKAVTEGDVDAATARELLRLACGRFAFPVLKKPDEAERNDGSAEESSGSIHEIRE